MFVADPRIDAYVAAQAWYLQRAFPVAHVQLFSSPHLQLASKHIAAPMPLLVPTRHGPVRILIYAPTEADQARARAAGQTPPVHLLIHGGAFIIGMPEQEDNVARYLAAEVGCFVVMPDYSTAPQVCFPVAEQQVYDVFRWMRATARMRGWDAARMSVGGPSAGGKLAINVVQQCLDAGVPGPVALSAEYSTCDLSRSDRRRPSQSPAPVVHPALMRLVRSSYFATAELTDPLASPYYEHRLDQFPPTLILTAGLDTLKHEMREFADALTAEGVETSYHEVEGVDHGFTHMLPVGPAAEALAVIAAHLRWCYAVARHRAAA